MTAAERAGNGASELLPPGRARLAEATRQLIDVVVHADVDDATLGAAASATDALVADLRRAAVPGDPSWWSGGPRQHSDYLPRSPVVGTLHPVAPPFAWEVRDGRFVGHAVLGAAFEGPPGYVHGGWVALLFDEALGAANVASANPGMTARLQVRYRHPTPLHTELRLEAWTTGRTGRRIVTVGTLHAGERLCAEAEGLFVDIGAERALAYFGDRPATEDPVDPLP